MDLTNIRTFLRVVETGSFAKAAEDLQYAPSTVTAQIQSLEREVGHALFERIGRRNVLTEIGGEFLEYANEMQHICQKVSAIGQQNKDTQVTLRIGALESLTFHTLLDVIALFRQTYKNARVIFKIGESRDLKDQLRQNELDLIFITDIFNTDPAFECLYRREEPILFLAGGGHELSGRARIPLRTVLQYPFVVPDPTGNCYNALCRLVALVGGEIQDSVMINNIGAISAFLQDDRSVSFLYASSVSKHLHTEQLTVLDVDVPAQLAYSQLLVRKQKWISPALEHLISIIRRLHPEGPEPIP